MLCHCSVYVRLSHLIKDYLLTYLLYLLKYQVYRAISGGQIIYCIMANRTNVWIKYVSPGLPYSSATRNIIGSIYYTTCN